MVHISLFVAICTYIYNTGVRSKRASIDLGNKLTSNRWQAILNNYVVICQLWATMSWLIIFSCKLLLDMYCSHFQLAIRRQVCKPSVLSLVKSLWLVAVQCWVIMLINMHNCILNGGIYPRENGAAHGDLGWENYKWFRSRRCASFLARFCCQRIAKPGNKTGPPSWPWIAFV